MPEDHYVIFTVSERMDELVISMRNSLRQTKLTDEERLPLEATLAQAEGLANYLAKKKKHLMETQP